MSVRRAHLPEQWPMRNRATVDPGARDGVGRIIRLVAALIALSLSAIWAIFALIAYQAYAREWTAASLVANNVTILLERDIARRLESFDLSLEAVVRGVGDPRVAALPSDLRHDVLFDQSTTATGLGSILVLDRNGNISLDSRSSTVSVVNLSDRDYFQIWRDGGAPAGSVYVSRPFKSRVANVWSIGLSRPVIDTEGHFAGVVIGAVRLSFFTTLFEALQLPKESTVALFDTSGRIIVRSPFDQAEIGTPVSPSMPPGAATQWPGEQVELSNFDGVRRLYVHRRVGMLPIVQRVGVSVDRFLSAVWRRIILVGAAFAIISAMILALGVALRKELRRRATAERALSDLATTDGLTGLTNRRRFDEIFEVEWRRSMRAASPLALLMIDCDSFKAYNDAEGHLNGDAVLRAVAGAIEGAISRASDVAARFGGEEFIVLLPATDASGAASVGETLRARVEALGITHRANALGVVTVSIGVACTVPDAGGNAASLVRAADHALYRAKAQGRNAVAIAKPVPGTADGRIPGRDGDGLSARSV